MANPKNKKTKDDFTSLILGIEPPGGESDSAKTRVLSDEKTNSIQSVKDDTISIGEQKSSSIFSSVNSDLSSAEKPQKASVPVQEVKFDPSMVSVEAALKQAELLRLSQNKIQELEKTNQELMQENETLSASAMVLQKKNDQLSAKLEDLKGELASQSESAKEAATEKQKSYSELKRDFDKLEKKYQEVHALTSEKFQAARRREKELLNRLEILQQEGDVVLTNKDERILSLKKEIDRHQFEVENLKTDLLDQKNKMRAYKEQVQRSLKALKLAGSLLEEDDTSIIEDLKKTGS